MIRHRTVEQAHRIVAEWEYSETQLDRANYSAFAFSQDEKIAFIASPNRYRVWGVDIASGKAGPPFKLETEGDNRSNRERRLKLFSDADGRTLCVLSVFVEHVQVEVLQRKDQGELRRVSSSIFDGKFIHAAFLPEVGYAVLMETNSEGKQKLVLRSVDQDEELWSRWRNSNVVAAALDNEWCTDELFALVDGDRLIFLAANRNQGIDEIEMVYPGPSAIVFREAEREQAFIPIPIQPKPFSLKNRSASEFDRNGLRDRLKPLYLANRHIEFNGFGPSLANHGQLKIGSPSALSSTFIRLNLKPKNSLPRTGRVNPKFNGYTQLASPKLEKVLQDGTLWYTGFKNDKQEWLIQVDFGIEQSPEFRRLMRRSTRDEIFKLLEAPIVEYDF